MGRLLARRASPLPDARASSAEGLDRVPGSAYAGPMARECFCGCGRRLGFKERSLSRRAAKIEAAADFLEEHSSRFGYAGKEQADVEGLIKDGRELRSQLVAVLHGAPNAREVDRHRIAQWRRQASALSSAYYVGPMSGGGGG